MDIGTRVRIEVDGTVMGNVLPQNRLDGTIDPNRPSILVDIGFGSPNIIRVSRSDIVPVILSDAAVSDDADVVEEAFSRELRRAIRYALVADEGFEWLKSYAAGEPGAWEELNAWDGRSDRPKPATVRDMTHG